MSRFKRFTHSLFSGYLLLGANILYTLASVPLALNYLSQPQFGLWALVTAIGTYIALIDFGMAGSISRILIDYKDNRQSSEYGSVIKTGALVNLVQGALILILGAGAAFFCAPLLKISTALQQSFAWLMLGQCGLIALTFAVRIFSHLLTAHQRYDITNYTGTLGFIVDYAVLWICFAQGLGVFSMLWAKAANLSVVTLLNWFGCVGLKLFPAPGAWGRPTRERFNELFAFGRDIFLYSLGGQLINTSQSILLTGLFGLETVAIWSVCTRGFTMLMQVIYRIFDYSTPALAEMIVRSERGQLARRFKEIVALSASLSVAAGILFATNNGPFVQLWTSGKIHWSPINDLLLALWLVMSVSVHAHTGLVGQTKRLGFMRFIFFLEGLIFVGLVLGLQRFGGMTAMLTVSILCSLAFSFPYGLRRTRQYFGLTWRELAAWHRAPWALVVRLVPVAAATWWLTSGLPPIGALVVCSSVVGLWSLAMFARHGLDAELKRELLERTSGRLHRSVRWLLQAKLAQADGLTETAT